MISDEAAGTGDTNVQITERSRRAGADSRVAGDAEIFVTGLAPRRSRTGPPRPATFADGITYWTGSGADTISVDGTHLRAGVRTVTSLNTGLGNDIVTVDLDSRRRRLLRPQHAGPGASTGCRSRPAAPATTTRRPTT